MSDQNITKTGVSFADYMAALADSGVFALRWEVNGQPAPTVAERIEAFNKEHPELCPGADNARNLLIVSTPELEKHIQELVVVQKRSLDSKHVALFLTTVVSVFMALLPEAYKEQTFHDLVSLFVPCFSTLVSAVTPQ